MLSEIGTAQRNCRGETVCGDTFAVFDGETLLVALADGLGHGPAAAEASQAFCAYVEANATRRLDDIISGSTKAISSTRGVVAALVRIDESAGKVSFSGIGNIELQAASSRGIRPVCIPGIIGRPLRKVLQFDYEFDDGDVLIVFSDGISTRFEVDKYRRRPAQEAANALLEDHGKYHDDATCLVIRCHRE